MIELFIKVGLVLFFSFCIVFIAMYLKDGKKEIIIELKRWRKLNKKRDKTLRRLLKEIKDIPRIFSYDFHKAYEEYYEFLTSIVINFIVIYFMTNYISTLNEGVLKVFVSLALVMHLIIWCSWLFTKVMKTPNPTILKKIFVYFFLIVFIMTLIINKIYLVFAWVLLIIILISMFLNLKPDIDFKKSIERIKRETKIISIIKNQKGGKKNGKTKKNSSRRN